jgi:hypothetical protein
MNSEQNRVDIGDDTHLNPLQRIIGVFTVPTKTFEKIDKKPDWIIPLAIVIVITMLFTYFSMPYIMEEKMVQQQEELVNSGLSQEEMDRALEIGKKFGVIFGFIGSGVGVIVVILVTVLILKFVGNVIFSGSGNYKSMFSVYTYASLVGALGLLIKLPLVLQQQTYDIHFSLASFLSTDQSKTFLYNFLKMFELFSIWQYILVAIGFAVVFRLSLKKAGWAIVVIFLIYSSIAAALATAFA